VPAIGYDDAEATMKKIIRRTAEMLGTQPGDEVAPI
jgi:hypothetical protein